MVYFKPNKRSIGCIVIIIVTIIINIIVAVTSMYINDYVLNIFLRIFLVTFNVYQLYYVLLSLTINYSYDEKYIYINYFWGFNKTAINFDGIEMYKCSSENIKAIQLTGYAKNNFAFGKLFFEKLGVINMYITSNEHMIFIKSKNGTYGISPEKFEVFEKKLISKGIQSNEWINERNTSIKIYKDLNFEVPLVLEAIVIIIFMAIPLWFYLKHQFPTEMPLSFDASFKPILMGSSKEFVFRQMEYGALNMAILFCMYYAAHFNAKYDKKLAYKYIYISLVISTVFLILQFKILQFFL